jgi:hypothetical protein
LQFTISGVTLKRFDIEDFSATNLRRQLRRDKVKELTQESFAALDGFCIPTPTIEAVKYHLQARLTAGAPIGRCFVTGRSGLGKSWFGRYARKDPSTHEVAGPHQLAAADTAENIHPLLGSDRMAHLASYVDAKIDLATQIKKFAAPRPGRKHASRCVVYLDPNDVRNCFVCVRRAATQDGDGGGVPALYREWADLDRYSALQAHFDACDEQLK